MASYFQFLHPQFLWLLVLIPILGFWYYWSRNTNKTKLIFGNTEGFKIQKSWKVSFRHLLPLLRLLALAALIMALARPVSRSVTQKIKTNRGVDIVLSIDISASMLARDLSPNRLEQLKKVAVNFVNNRVNDRIGLVTYAGESYTKVPITTDKEILIKNIKNLNWGELDGGTAIGMGLGSAINRIKDSKAKSKIIILMTDGVNNAGFIDPITAAEIAREYGIKVYTIGIGTNGMAMFPVAKNPDGSLIFQNQPVEIDEVLLKKIAQITNGKYYRATSNSKLQDVFDAIDKLEKTETEELKYENFDELYRKWIFIALGLLAIEFIMRKTILRSFI